MPHASDKPDVIAGGLGADAWQLLVDSANDAYVCIDGDGAVLRWNVPAVELFGWERHEAVGTMLAD